MFYRYAEVRVELDSTHTVGVDLQQDPVQRESSAAPPEVAHLPVRHFAVARNTSEDESSDFARCLRDDGGTFIQLYNH